MENEVLYTANADAARNSPKRDAALKGWSAKRSNIIPFRRRPAFWTVHSAGRGNLYPFTASDFVTLLTAAGKSRVLTKRISMGSDGNPVLRDYDQAKRFIFEKIAVGGLSDLARAIDGVGSNTAIVLGEPTDAAVMGARRLAYDRPESGERATLAATAHRWLPIDLDSVPCPEGLDPLADPEAAVVHVVRHYLPAQMHGRDVFWQLTSSAGFKPGIRLRLFFSLDRPLSCKEMKQWLGRLDYVDGAIYTPNQPIYVAKPIFAKGVTDPVPRRAGILTGAYQTVSPPDLIPPPQSQPKGEGTPKNGVRGYAAWCQRIGDHPGGEGFHEPINKAIGSYVGANGGVDIEWLQAHLERVIRAAPRDPSVHSDSYIERLIRQLNGWISWTQGREQQQRKAGAEGGPAAPPAEGSEEDVLSGWEINPHTRRINSNTLANVKKALILLKVSARHDVFANRMLITVGAGPEQLLDDAIGDRLWLGIEEAFRFRPTRELFDTVLRDMAHQHGFHPVCDYISGLKWDGTARLDTWLFTYGNAPRRGGAYDRYVAAVGRIMLLAAVRRVRQPGCKFDEMLVLVSEKQGLDKSTALKILAVRPGWFTDSIDLGARDKEAIEQLAGKWIVEIAELHGRRRNDIDRIKTFLSRESDRARLAYGHFPTEQPRHNVFFGSCNDTKFLQDRTGNRRFWPILGVKFDVEALQRDRDQLWAEAAEAEAAGDSIRLGQELWSVAETVQSESLEVEPWTEALATALGDFEGKIRSTDIWSILDIEVKNRKSADDNRMGAAIRELGWERKQLRYGHGPEWGYVKGKSAAQVHVWRDRRTSTLFVYQGRMLRKIVNGQAVKQELDHDVSPADFVEDDGYGGERWSGPKFKDW